MDPHALGPYPFTRAQILAAGISPWRWREAVASGRLHRLRRGVYVLQAGSDDRTRHAQQAAAELVTRPGHFAVADSAAAFHGLPNPWFAPWDSRPVQVAGPRSRSERGIAKSPGLVPVQTPWGLAADPAAAAVAVAERLPLPNALMVTDHVARLLAGTSDRFELAAQRCRARVQATLREHADVPATQLADPAAESPAESFCRGHMLLAGFPEPRCGVPHRGASGAQYFVDLLLGELAIEVDGLVKYTQGMESVVQEKVREDDLRATGMVVHRVFVEHLFADPAREMGRLRRTWTSRIGGRGG